MFLSPLYIYLVGGVLFGWTGGRITAPDNGLNDWKPAEHQLLMISCRRLCDNQVVKYEPVTGDCVCRKPSRRMK